MARLGAPARRFRRAYVEEGMNHEIHEIHERWNNRTTNGHEWDTNNFFIGKKVVRGWRARASLPPRVPYMIPSLPLTPRHLPCSKDAHCKVSTHYFLPSSLFSLLLTDAHCKVSTHSPLPSFPSSLLLTDAHCKVTTHYLLSSSPFSLLFTIPP